ncbi:VOC family protein [Alkalihalobacillus oceani]|uniref:VOC family protein n=1 Tax=Halalkalibacter oceani TaxID=1653776 RepID=UPI0020421AE7|nr:VOC family protein [Halalkalibacter oceani]MCM3762908.1 VOC family protein [Halalkalibacter oceani]
MKPTVAIISIPVKSLERAERFYREMFELAEDQISAGDDHLAFFLEGGLSLVLVERAAFAEMTGQKLEDAGPSTLILSHTADTEAEVDDILIKAEKEEGKIFKQGTANEWGYSGSFKDPDGHVWEITAWKSE